MRDAVLPAGGVARLVVHTPSGTPIVLAVKAGHNDENHNQNDVGSFVVHVAGENLLTDPGRGLYSRAYFGPQRYDNIFANSYGYSVPRIGGQLQGTGREFCGKLLGVETVGAQKSVTVEFAHAYAVEGLTHAQRRLVLAAEGEQAGTIWLHDDFRAAQNAPAKPCEVEEALIT